MVLRMSHRLGAPDDWKAQLGPMRAARTGKCDSEVIEEAVRPELGLDLLERASSRNKLSEAR
jgi:hypothetical protein